MIHVTTCNPADREWRSLNELNINQVNVNCEEGQQMAARCPQYDYRGLTHLRQLSLLQDKNKAPADPTKDGSLCGGMWGL